LERWENGGDPEKVAAVSFVTQAILSATGRTRCGEPASNGDGLPRER